MKHSEKPISIQTNIRVPVDLKNWLAQEAEAKGRSQTGLIIAILLSYQAQLISHRQLGKSDDPFLYGY